MLISSLADWVEWMAVISVSPSWANIVDVIVDTRDTSLYAPKLTGGAYSDNDEIDVREALRNTVEERIALLDDYYPFVFDERDRFVVRDNYCFSSSAYIPLLEISLLKGWTNKEQVPYKSYTDLFEWIVAKSFKEAGFDTSLMGTSRAGGQFDERLKRVSAELGIPTYPSNAAHSSRARDEKVDVVAGWFFKDQRKGEAINLIQATCANDCEWEAKLNSIPTSRWQIYFAEKLIPRAYLAIPYHASDENACLLTELDSNCSFVDRIRLVLMLKGEIVFEENDSRKLLEEMNAFVEQYLFRSPSET